MCGVRHGRGRASAAPTTPNIRHHVRPIALRNVLNALDPANASMPDYELQVLAERPGRGVVGACRSYR